MSAKNIYYSKELEQYFKTAENLQIAGLLIHRLEGVKEQLLSMFQASEEPLSMRDIEAVMDSGEEKWMAHVAAVMMLHENVLSPADESEVLTASSALILEDASKVKKRKVN